jgi:hypothetical protein
VAIDATDTTLGAAALSPARLVSVNVGKPRSVDSGRRSVTTAIWKDPVEGKRASGSSAL